jgi:hypothetical protein
VTWATMVIWAVVAAGIRPRAHVTVAAIWAQRALVGFCGPLEVITLHDAKRSRPECGAWLHGWGSARFGRRAIEGGKYERQQA